MKRFNLFMAMCLAVIVSSCTIAKISGTGSKALLLNNPTQKVEMIGQLDEEKMIVFDYTNSHDISEIVSETLKNNPKADAVTNIRITLKTSVGSTFINMFTLGLANAHVIEVKGDLVKLNGNLSEYETEKSATINLTDLENKGEVKFDELFVK